MANNKKSGFGFSPVSLTGPGTAFTLGFIGLAIGFGILLSRGVTPKSTLTDPGQDQSYEMVIETPAPNAQKGLQLKTIKFKECADKAAVGLLVDRSGSMGTKMNDLKSALTTFTGSLGAKSVIGMTSFSSNDDGATRVTEDVPFSRYLDVKAQVSQAIQNLRGLGSTNTRAAFTFMKDKIVAAQKKFPDNTFALIFLSDGVPQTNPRDCTSGREYNTHCYANSEDPTQGTDLSQEIKDEKIRIFSIALYNANYPEDMYFLPDMKNLLQKIASTDSYYETPNTSELKQIYKDIAQKICNDVK